ncbi:uncharacterized protein C11orf24 homolog isoform X1 [Neofelis nebulosa]|uniref:uncharacterized protein C11orf24 homolog isoform X1 n=2 Tax=Neofelis nebulosa TaxID=61452 RepID=UPI0027297296|nr:uncharacterized protein C11orf24 homolog isoform X1 [Neofelis nebulosa]
MRLLAEWGTCPCRPCAPEHAMAWGCASSLLSRPAQPDLGRRAHGAKPAALHGGRWPSLGARPERLPLVSVHGPARRATCLVSGRRARRGPREGFTTEWEKEESKRERQRSPEGGLFADPSARQQGIVSSLRSGQLGTSGTAQPCSWLTHKMWTALVLVWISSLSLSESKAPSQDLRHLVFSQTANSSKNASVTAAVRVLNDTSGTMTVLTPPVTLTTGTLGADPSSPAVTAGSTFRTDTAGPAASGGPSPASAASTRRTPSSATAPGAAPAPAPSVSPLPRTTAPATSATVARTTAGTTANASAPTGTRGPPVASPAPPASPHALDASTRGPAVRASTARPGAGTTSGPTPTLADTTPEPTRPSTAPVAPVSTTAVTATEAQAREPAASTPPAPAPDSAPTPKVEATAPTTRPGPAPSTRGAAGPDTPRTPQQVRPETPPGTASTAPTPGSSGGSQVPASAPCPLSTQGPYLVVTTRPLPQALVNKSFLLAVLLLGVTLFLVVLVLLGLQAYESYRKKEYTQVDYLINGMYADSEM